ncbi:MAG TPA: GntR family transcriptional regulator [Syntrophales bacterium]|nr:GntR family transcriptional regulator [Syntrophales bacterium]
MVSKRLEKSVREDIYEKIRDDITFGRHMSGERLTEKKLSDLYGVSRHPIREALRKLESEGLITFQRNKGIEVIKLSGRQLGEIYDVRELLESAAVRMAVEKATKKEIARLEGLHKKMLKAAKKHDMQAWLQYNTLFHGFFRDKADNDCLCQLIIMLKRRIYRYQYMPVSYPHFIDIYAEHHAALIECCKKKDAAMAEKVMRIHVRKVKDVVMKDTTSSLSTTRKLSI